jgi:RimJ/RimL family protein N-acetyltransferase
MRNGRIFLRVLAAEDAQLLYRAGLEDGMQRFMPEMTFQNPAHAHFFIESVESSLRDPPEFSAGHFFAAVRRFDGAFLGIAGIAPREGVGMELGYLIFERYRRMGYGLEAAELALAYARAGVNEEPEVYDQIAAEECAKMEAALRGVAVPNESNPAKIDWKLWSFIIK